VTLPPITLFDALAADQVGVPYVFGGTSLAGSTSPGLDCSGLVFACCAALGVTIPRTSEAQYAGLPAVPTGNLRQGDLIFYDVPTDDQAQPAHEAIWWSGTEVLQAPFTGEDVQFSPPLPYVIMGFRRLPFPNAAPPPTPTSPISMEDDVQALLDNQGRIVLVGTSGGHTVVVTQGADSKVEGGWSVADVTDAIEAAYPGTVTVLE